MIYIVVFVFIIILFLLRNKKENFDVKNTIKKKICILRIIGNDLKNVHSGRQSLNNLKFILKNETDFSDCDKVWILNRIVDKDLEKTYIKILKKNKKKFIQIPFEKNEYKKIKKQYPLDFNKIKPSDCYKKLYHHNLYVININKARNIGLNYGREKYKYSLVLDGNCFLRKDHYKTIINNTDNKSYLILPMIRINNNNEINNNLNNYKRSEPQIGFKNTSKLQFNETFPYGSSDKAELLRVLSIPGPWLKWDDNRRKLNIKDRENKKASFKFVSNVIRLSNGTKKQQSNSPHRSVGIYNLIKETYFSV